MRILGVHETKNSSACLMEDNKIKYVMQEERLTNVKNYRGFPVKSILKILDENSLSMEDIDIVALSSHYRTPSFPPKQIIDHYKKEYKLSTRFKNRIISILKNTPIYNQLLKKQKLQRIQDVKNIGEPKEIVFIDHHTSHAAAGFYGSGFQRYGDTLILVADGSGDGLCASVWIGRSDGKMEKISETPAGHSVGNIYSRCTFMMGFTPLEHEYKIMGLSAYNKGDYDAEAKKIFNSYLKVDGMKFRRKISEPTNYIYPRMRKDFEFQRFDNISSALQSFTEEIMCKWVENCVKKTGIHNVVLSGGVFMNVKVNKLIREMPFIKNLFIFPSCSDESLCIGSAYQTYAEDKISHGEEVDIPKLEDIYLGNNIDTNKTEKILEKRKDLNFYKMNKPEKEIGDLLSENKIIARCSGRMEFGARALGNRSILCDASNLENIQIINKYIKNRDFWMPFAPVILDRYVDEYLADYGDKYSADYMIMAYDTKPVAQKEIIAALHRFDYTARPQVIKKDWNQEYYEIIENFEKNKGIGGLLNTSYNLHGYPLVSDVDDALWVFDNSDLEYMQLDRFLVAKK